MRVNAPFGAAARGSLGDVPGLAAQLRSLAVAETTTTLTADVSTDRFGQANSVFLPRSLSSSCLRNIQEHSVFQTGHRQSVTTVSFMAAFSENVAHAQRAVGCTVSQ